MHPDIERFVTEIPTRLPQTFKAVYPRRITPPGGYLNPKYFSASLWSALQVGFEPEMTMLPHVTGVMNALALVHSQVPTYFVRSEFAQAVAQTEPPADFKFSEIMWPMPAMLFVLPTSFSLNYFGFAVPFLSVTRANAGIYPNDYRHLPKCEMPLHALHTIKNQVDRFLIVYPVYGKDATPVDYTGSYPMTMNVSEIASAPYEDATYMEEEKFLERFGTYELDRNAPDVPSAEQEQAFNIKVQAFAVKLMLALTAKPNYITLGTQSRKEKMKHGRVREEIWNPNLIGWEYKAQRTAATPGDGTHASPRMHWRRGHMRNQPYGPKPWSDTTPKKLLWIEPVLIGAQEEVTV